jgi:hypothetical protein
VVDCLGSIGDEPGLGPKDLWRQGSVLFDAAQERTRGKAIKCCRSCSSANGREFLWVIAVTIPAQSPAGFGVRVSIDPVPRYVKRRSARV